MDNVIVATLVATCAFIAGCIVGGMAQEEKMVRECNLSASTVLKQKTGEHKSYVCFAKKE